jgi:hypothetical protein
LIYLSRRSLSALYPFSHFLKIARSWDYFVLFVSVLPLLVLYETVSAGLLDTFGDSLIVVFVALALVLLGSLYVQIVFIRLGALVTASEEMREVFADVIDGQNQRTLAEFERR